MESTWPKSIEGVVAGDSVLTDESGSLVVMVLLAAVDSVEFTVADKLLAVLLFMRDR